MQANLPTILHADRLPMLRMGMSCLIENNPNYTLLKSDLDDGDMVLSTIFRKQPTIAILDYNLYGVNAFEVAECIFKNNLPTKVIIVCEPKHINQFTEVQREQINIGILMRDAKPDEIEKCFDEVSNNSKAYVSIEYFKLREKRQHLEIISIEERYKNLALKKLSMKEKKVLQLISGGNSTMEIADNLCLSHRTIDAHRSNILKKLCLKGKTALVRFAVENRYALK